jgi:hypothetical protein
MSKSTKNGKRQPCEFLVKLNRNKEVVAIAPAIQPIKTANGWKWIKARTPPGWSWIDGWTVSYEYNWLK